MTQPTLFPLPAVRAALNKPSPVTFHNGTSTSRAAAAAIAPVAGTQEARVLAYLALVGPCSRKGIARGTGMELASVCARTNALVTRGLLKHAGESVEDGRTVELVEVVKC